MAYKLKKLKITSADLVDQGANPEAQVGLLKRKASDFMSGLFGGGAALQGGTEHWGLQRSGGSIWRNELTPNSGKTAVTSVDTNLDGAFSGLAFSQGKVQENELYNTGRGGLEMKLEEKAILEVARQIAEKYGLEMPIVGSGETISQDAPVVKGYQAKIASLEKAVAMQEMVEVAKGYDLLGLQEDVLAEKLYDMKLAGFYEDYIAVLNRSLVLVEQSGLFGEIGGRGSLKREMPELLDDVQKREDCSEEMAFMKAYAENAEFAKAYDAGYGMEW